MVTAVMVLAFAVFASAASAEDLAGSDPEGARALADKYAPIMMLKAQEASCDQDGEP